MGRNAKQTVDYFPKWNPYRLRTHSIERAGYKYLRNSSSSFISRKDVRKIVFGLRGSYCNYCNNIENLQIDHIISVYQFFHIIKDKDIILEKLNCLDNLQILCNKCNASKPPII